MTGMELSNESILWAMVSYFQLDSLRTHTFKCHVRWLHDSHFGLSLCYKRLVTHKPVERQCKLRTEVQSFENSINFALLERQFIIL
jgi:hypothetical protein